MRLASLIPLLALAGCAAPGPELGFDTEAGDAWTFDLRLSGEIRRGQCDSVEVRAPAGTITATLIDHRFVAQVPLRSGVNRIEALCRGSREAARSEAQQWRLPLEERPKAWVRTRVEGDIVQLDAGRTEWAPGAPAPLVGYEWRAREHNPASLRIAGGDTLGVGSGVQGKQISLAAPSHDGEYYVELHVEDALGRRDSATGVFRVAAGRAEEVRLESEHPQWVDSAILYGVAPYMFEPQNFAGVRARLDEIAALGATAIWLSPVTAASEDDFGYAVTDPFRIRERFGTQAELRELIEEAHRLGLRVLIDFVPNHFSRQHPYFEHAERRGERSPYYDWFERDEGGDVRHYFDWTHLKNLDYDNVEVQNYITAAFVQFVRDYDVDGFRVDASWAVARRAPEFWPRLREELKRIDPDILLLAEASAREGYHVAHGFDAAYDWTERLGEWAWEAAFAERGTVDLARLRAALTNHGEGFPPDSLVLRFLNNNDTGERFATRHGPKMAELAATMLLTLPGLPLIYNGDEMAAAFEPYDEGPPIEWNDEHPLVEHYRKLAELRRTLASLRTRDMQLLSTDRGDALLAYLRPGTTRAEDVLVLINFSPAPLTAQARGTDTRAVFARFTQSSDLLTGTDHSLGHAGAQLQGFSALLLRRKD